MGRIPNCSQVRGYVTLRTKMKVAVFLKPVSAALQEPLGDNLL